MSAKKGIAGVGQVLLNSVIGIVATGILLAILQLFNFDIFALIQTVVDWIWGAISGVADFFTGNGTFRDIFQQG